MSHVHSTRKKKYSSLKYQVMLGLDHSGCYQASILPTAMTQPRPLLFLILRLLSLPLFNEGPEYHHGKILELKMFVLEF